MQAAKKEHARLLRQKAQNEQQLRTFQGELSELKRTKVRLMKQMKEEAAKNKQQEAQRNKQIAQLKKESRVRQMTIKNLEMEKRQREIVLKRKQEEVSVAEFLLLTTTPLPSPPLPPFVWKTHRPLSEIINISFPREG